MARQGAGGTTGKLGRSRRVEASVLGGTSSASPQPFIGPSRFDPIRVNPTKSDQIKLPPPYSYRRRFDQIGLNLSEFDRFFNFFRIELHGNPARRVFNAGRQDPTGASQNQPLEASDDGQLAIENPEIKVNQTKSRFFLNPPGRGVPGSGFFRAGHLSPPPCRTGASREGRLPDGLWSAGRSSRKMCGIPLFAFRFLSCFFNLHSAFCILPSPATRHSSHSP